MASFPEQISRRGFLRTGAAAGLLAAMPAGRARAEPAARSERGRARNLVFVVSDGMSMGTVTLAELYARAIESRGTHWASLFNTPGVHHGLQDTASANALVTDSAAASSAWGCGHRVNNGSLNITPDGTAREPILMTARRAGKGTGVVTTTRVTHATPAGFIANVHDRAGEDDIAVQYLERGIDVMLGGGRKHFAAGRRADGRDLESEFAAAGCAVLADRAALAASPDGGRMLGVFGDDHLPFAIDRKHGANLAARVPSLAEMTRTALARLGRGPEGFVLQVEGGRVDQAAHANDAGALVHEQLDLDAALAEVLGFQRTHPDTLVVVTTDHGTGSPSLTGADSGVEALRRLSRIQGSFEAMTRGLTPRQTVEEWHARLTAVLGLPLTLAEAEVVQAAHAENPDVVNREMRKPASVLGQVLANHVSVGWASGSHTADWVLLNAFGPGAEAFPALVRNDALHALVLDALGLG